MNIYNDRLISQQYLLSDESNDQWQEPGSKVVHALTAGVSGQNGPKSKRPKAETAPYWSKRPQLQLQIGQNGPKNGLKFDLGFK